MNRFTRTGIKPLPAGVAVLAGAAILALPSARSIPLIDDVRNLSADSPLLSFEVNEPFSASDLVIDSYLSGSHGVAPGKRIASVRIISPDGNLVQHDLRAGIETGEWAARRQDVALRPGFAAPPPWLSWVEPTRTFFAQRYRHIWQLETSCDVARVEIERHLDLDPDVGIAVFFVEIRP